MDLEHKDWFAFNPVLAEMVASGVAIGRSGRRFERLAALSTANNLIALRNLQLSLGPIRTLEIGLAFGGSCLVFAQTHRDTGELPAKQHVAIDPYQGGVWDDAGLCAVDCSGLRDYLDFRPALSSLELPRMVERGERFGLVYIDGSHLYEDVFVDFYFVARLLSEGGVVIFDDSTDPHVYKALRFIRRSLKSSFHEIDLRPYRKDKGKSYRYRLGRMLGKTQMTGFRRIGEPSRQWDAAFVDF